MNDVKHFYERWTFPGLDFLSREGLLLLRYLNKWLREESNETRTFIDIGCGTGNTIISLAKHFPATRFLGVDVSASSLEIAARLAKKAGVTNVTFRRADIRKDVSFLGKFRVALSTGVLHHIKDMDRAFAHAAQPVEEGGYLVLWFYGRYGRQEHSLNRLFLKELTKKIPGSDLFPAARDFLEDLGDRFAVDSGFYTPKGSGKEGIAWLLEHPQWLADQMVPAFEQCVCMKEILALFEKNNLRFVKWLGVPVQLKEYTSSARLLECFETLSFHEQLVAVDYLIKPDYYFVAGQKKGRE